MPVHDGSGSNEDKRLPPPGPEHFQGNPEQLVQGSQSTARSLRVQSQQLLMESQVFEDEVRARAKRANDPPEEMPERNNHVKNFTETSQIQLYAKSFILRVYDVFGEAQVEMKVLFLSFVVGLGVGVLFGLIRAWRTVWDLDSDKEARRFTRCVRGPRW